MAAFGGAEGEEEGIVGLHRNVLLQHHRVVMHDFGAEAYAFQIVPGITLQDTAHGHVVAPHVELLHRVETELEGREHELVHTEPVIAESHHFQFEAAVAEVFRKDEFSGDGAPGIGGQVQGSDDVVLGIVQPYFQFFPFDGFQAGSRISVEDNGFELHGVSGVVGTPVTVDVAAETVVVAGGGETALDGYRIGFPVSAYGHKLVVYIPLGGVQHLVKSVGNRGEAVQFEGGAGDLLVAFHQKERGGPERDAGLVVGHIDAAAAAVGPRGDREGILGVARFVKDFPVPGIREVVAVREDGKFDGKGIVNIEAVFPVVQLPAFYSLFPLAEGQVGLGEVPEADLDGTFHNPDIDVLVGEGPGQFRGISAAFHQRGLVPLKGFPLFFQGLGILAKGLVSVGGAVFAVQPVAADAQEFGLREYGHGLSGIAGRQLLIGCNLLIFLGQRPVAGGNLVKLQGGLIGILAVHLRGEGLENLVVLDGGVGAVLDHPPEDVLPVGADKGLESAAEEPVHPFVEGPITALEPVRMRLHISPELVRRGVLPVVHPQEGDDGFVKGLHLLLEGGAEGRLLLPVAALDAVNVLGSGVVKVDGKMPCRGFLLDLGQDFRLFLGAVGF